MASSPLTRNMGTCFMKSLLKMTHQGRNNHLHALLVMDAEIQGRVIQRAKNPDRTKKGTSHKNPLFDTQAYLVDFKDDSVAEYNANIITENICSQIDEEGCSFSILKEISNHHHDNTAITRANGLNISYNGNQIPKKTTRGWQLQVEWKDGTSEWLPLKQVKDHNPIELAEYTVAHKIQDEPVFARWVHDTLQRRVQIISKLKPKYWHTTHKFGIRLPKDTEEALRIDKEMGKGNRKGITKNSTRTIPFDMEILLLFRFISNKNYIN